MKIFDLSKEYKFIGKDVQKNISVLYKKFGKRFTIKYKKMKVPVSLYKRIFKHSGKTFFILEYYQTKRTEELKPFKIEFIDESSSDYKLNNTTYIANIHNTNEISGSQMVDLVVSIQRKLNVIKTTLFDGATIHCNNIEINLSFFKLIEKNRTFYQKFGFKYSTDGIWPLLKAMFGNKKNVQKIMHNSLNLFKKIKISEYITKHKQVIDLISNIIKKQDYHKTDISSYDFFNNDPRYVKSSKIEEHLIEQVGISNKVLKICMNTKKKYLYQLLIELLNNKKCQEYDTIMKYIVENNQYQIKYMKKTITFNYIKLFNIIGKLKQARFELEL